MFIHTGLLIKSSDPSEVIGVIAHETGHIIGGHLALRSEAMKNAESHSLIGYVLGGAALIAGRPDVGAAIMKGGQASGVTAFLNYSRGQESSADQAGLRLLDATKQSALGLKNFLGVLADQDLLSPQYQSPYMRTHPVTRSRIDFVEQHLKNSKYSQVEVDPVLLKLHDRMRAKLKAFLEPPNITLRYNKETDKSINARYSRSIALYRQTKLTEALPLIDSLIEDEPENPYFWELKGQMLFENGNITEALPAYQKAVNYAPKSSLILVDLARVEIALNDTEKLLSAIEHLQEALRWEPRSPFSWRQLAIAAGRTDKKGMASLALAEEAYLLNSKNDALFHTAQAEKYLKRGSRPWLRIQDIKALMGLDEKQDKKQTRK